MIFKVFKCKVCGNMTVMLRSEKAKMSCCGQEMENLTVNTVDAATEKHIPFVKKEDTKVIVQVGEVEHPMLEEHHIEWIAQVIDNNFNIKYLNPGEKPEATFDDIDGAKYYEYCNLHGLWRK